MTIVDEIIEELRKGTSLKAIQARYGTGGRMVEAYRQYIPEFLLALSTEPQEMKLIAKSDMEFLLTRMIEWYRLYGKIFPRVKLLDLDPSPSVGFKQLRFEDTISWSLTILRLTTIQG